MQDIMIRIETNDFDAWKEQHYLHAENRTKFGIHDGPAYQGIDNPDAALFTSESTTWTPPCSGSTAIRSAKRRSWRR